MALIKSAVALAGLVGLWLGVRRQRQNIEPWMSDWFTDYGDQGRQRWS